MVGGITWVSTLPDEGSGAIHNPAGSLYLKSQRTLCVWVSEH